MLLMLLKALILVCKYCTECATSPCSAKAAESARRQVEHASNYDRPSQNAIGRALLQEHSVSDSTQGTLSAIIATTSEERATRI